MSRVVGRTLERRRRLGDAGVVPVLTVRFEPPLTDADCARLEAEHNDMTKASWVGSVRIESARVRTDAVDLTLAPLTADHVPLETLRRHARVGLSAELAVSFLVDVATAMSGDVHGGLHPRRVVVLADGEVKLVGTRARGLSRVLAPAVTKEERDVWLAPEQRWGAAPDERSDVHALGLLLFWLLTDDLDTPSLVRRARTASHEPTLPLGVAEAIMRAVNEDPELRYPDPLAFCQAVTAHVMPSNDRAVITEALRYIIDAGRGGLAAMLGAVEVEPKNEGIDPFTPLEEDPAVADFDALDPSEAAEVVEVPTLETRSLAVSVAPVAGFEKPEAMEHERVSVAPPVALDVPRVIKEKSNVEYIEERPVQERALPLPVRDVPPLMPETPPAGSAAPTREALERSTSDYDMAPAIALPAPESHTPQPPPMNFDFDDEPWAPTHLPATPVPEPTPSRRPLAIGAAVLALGVLVSLGWAFAPRAEPVQDAKPELAVKPTEAKPAETPATKAERTEAAATKAEPAEPEAVAAEPETSKDEAEETTEAATTEAEAAAPLDLMTIMSQPSGATVSIDGRIVGRTPFVMKSELQPREYRVELRLPGHERWERIVTPNADHGTISLVAKLVENVAEETATTPEVTP